jgi:hypothetical protein
MDVQQFWYGVLTIVGVQVIIQIANIIISRNTTKSQAPVVGAQAQQFMNEAWETLAQEYARQIEGMKKLEIENSELRPLVLKIAIQDRELLQTHEDKEDWKRYAGRLAKQLEGINHIPLPFRRTPSDNDTDKFKAVSDKLSGSKLQEETSNDKYSE